MANLNKPKESVKAPAGPPESEEERKERLRKEERRKRRVHWREEKDPRPSTYLRGIGARRARGSK